MSAVNPNCERVHGATHMTQARGAGRGERDEVGTWAGVDFPLCADELERVRGEWRFQDRV